MRLRVETAKQRVLEEPGVGRAEQRSLLAALLEHDRRKRAGAAQDRLEHGGGGQRVVESTVRGLGDDLGVRGQQLERVRRRAREDDRGELGRVEARHIRIEAGALEEGNVEADVVPDERRSVAEERAQAGHCLGGRRRAHEVVGADPGQPRHGGAERAAGVDERDEAVGQGDAAGAVDGEADGADLDDAVEVRVEARRLEIDRDELLRGALF